MFLFHAEQKGLFVFQKEEDDSDVHVSGLWMGKADVDPKLSEFYVPSNPIYWSLAIIKKSSVVPSGCVFGSGFFDDSGDIPDQPLLFFTLFGSIDLNTSSVQLIKKYQKHLATEGYDVLYEAVLDKSNQDNRMRLHGRWTNTKAGTMGPFSCFQDSVLSNATSSLLCDSCAHRIEPGKNVYNCTVCINGWNSCESCYTSQKNPHSHPLECDAVHEPDIAEGSCCSEVILNAFQKFGKRKLLGHKVQSEQSFQWITYSQVQQLSLDVVAAFRHFGITPRSFVAFCADISPPYAVLLLSSVLLDLILVPIHATLEEEGMVHIFRKTNPSSCIVGSEYAEKVAKCLKEAKVNSRLTIVIKSKELSAHSTSKDSSNDTNTTSTTVELEELLSLGHKLREESKSDVQVEKGISSDAVRAILFTSGSTGAPKGAIYTEKLVLPSNGLPTLLPTIRFDFQPFHPSFLISLLQTVYMGGMRALSTNLETMMQDLLKARPTHISASPVFWNSLYQDYLSRLKTQSPQKDAKVLEQQAADEIRASLGNRLIAATCGGSDVSSTVIDFLRKKLGLKIVNAYGSRETGGLAHDGFVHPGVELKLLPVPDLGLDGLTVGEVCVHTKDMISGYFGEPELTQKSFVDIEGKTFYKTGDIGEFHPKERRIRLIDRVGALTKLSQGEWISPSKVESVIEQCPLIQQALVMGESQFPYLVAVIVPSSKLTEFWETSNADSDKLKRCNLKVLQEIR